jgi:hypothetical protein
VLAIDVHLTHQIASGARAMFASCVIAAHCLLAMFVHLIPQVEGASPARALEWKDWNALPYLNMVCPTGMLYRLLY